jgi:hypothetical protein
MKIKSLFAEISEKLIRDLNIQINNQHEIKSKAQTQAGRF